MLFSCSKNYVSLLGESCLKDAPGFGGIPEQGSENPMRFFAWLQVLIQLLRVWWFLQENESPIEKIMLLTGWCTEV